MVVVWGVNFAVVKRALATFPPLGFNALRFVLASLFVLAVLRSRGALQRPEARDIPRFIILGLVGNVLYQLAFILGLERTRAGNASLMLSLSPMFTALLSAASGGSVRVREPGRGVRFPSWGLPWLPGALSHWKEQCGHSREI